MTARIGATLAFFLGLTAAIVLVAYHGFEAVGRLIVEGSEGVVPLLAGIALQTVLAGMAWRIVLGDIARGRTGALIAYRWIRNAVNALLPVGRVGGDVVGARLLVLSGVRADVSAASVLADKTLEVIAMIAFAWCALGVGFAKGFAGDIMLWATIGLALFTCAIAAFVALQRAGLVKMAERILLKIADYLKEKRRVETGTTQDELWRIYGHRRRVAAALVLHGLGWSSGAVGVWLALDVMGHPISLTDAIVLEGLTQAIAGAAFLMPAALGAQEAGYMMVGTLLGLAPEVGLAVSLVRRMAELALGVPGLVAWQVLEGKRALAHWSARQRTGGEAVRDD